MSAEKDFIPGSSGEDWTEYCNRANVDTVEFAEWLQAARSGEHVERSCPFCGGKVGVRLNENGHTVIGCDSCDMRIDLEVR